MSALSDLATRLQLPDLYVDPDSSGIASRLKKSEELIATGILQLMDQVQDLQNKIDELQTAIDNQVNSSTE